MPRLCAGWAASLGRTSATTRQDTASAGLAWTWSRSAGSTGFSARVYLVFAVHVAPWTQHLPTCRVFLRRAFEAAQETGDLTYAAYSCDRPDHEPSRLRRSARATSNERPENALEFVRKMRFGLISDLITGQLRLIRMLRGLTPTLPPSMTRSSTRLRFEQHLESNPQLAIAACRYWIRKLQACVYAGDYASAVAAASKVAPLLWTVPSQFELAEYHFYAALARAARCDTASAEERPQHLEALAAHHRQIALWAKNCPETFANRAALVGAEIARLEGRELDAMRLYEEAIRLGARARLHPERGLGPRARRAVLRGARLRDDCRTPICGTPGTAISAGAPTARCGSSSELHPQLARGSGAAASHGHHRRARRAAGRRDGGQGFAGGVGRDRTRQAHRNPDDDRDSSMRAPSVACSSFSGATSRGSWRRPPPATAESRSRFERQP